MDRHANPSMRRSWLVVAGSLFVFVFGAWGWATDFLTRQGERTVYTAQCKQGRWIADRCSGKLVAGERYRFRALKRHGEVLFWTVGASAPSGRYTECRIASGRAWSCPANADAARTITMEMAAGIPVPDRQGRTRVFHLVSKPRWLMLRYVSGRGDGGGE
jgi:hypothetical protein